MYPGTISSASTCTTLLCSNIFVWGFLLSCPMWNFLSSYESYYQGCQGNDYGLLIVFFDALFLVFVRTRIFLQKGTRILWAYSEILINDGVTLQILPFGFIPSREFIALQRQEDFPVCLPAYFIRKTLTKNGILTSTDSGAFNCSKLH